jgi:hypothetical protein
MHATSLPYLKNRVLPLGDAVKHSIVVIFLYILMVVAFALRANASDQTKREELEEIR